MPCIVRYNVLVAHRGDFAHGCALVGVFEEDPEPDEWGDPGRLVRRKALRFEGPSGSVKFEQVHSGTCHGWTYLIGDRVGPLEWSQS